MHACDDSCRCTTCGGLQYYAPASDEHACVDRTCQGAHPYDSFRRSAKMKPAAKGKCRGCGGDVPKGRRTWCSDACVQAALIKLSPSTARWHVFHRDAGVCAECGADTEQQYRVASHLCWNYRRGNYEKERADGVAQRDAALIFLLNLWQVRSKPYATFDRWMSLPHFWEADHVTPVVEGGGGCGLDNYRTLCRACHRRATADLRARMAADRRRPKAALGSTSAF